MIVVLKTRITKIKDRPEAVKFNLILGLDYAMKPHKTCHKSGKYLFKKTYLIIGLQYSPTPLAAKFNMKTKDYHFQAVLSSPLALLMVFEACSLAPCLDPSLQRV